MCLRADSSFCARSLDALLLGGVREGVLTELAGESTSGKSQLLMQVTVACGGKKWGVGWMQVTVACGGKK
eukprot:340169-Chlamydomonas_euryale.AAC.1